MKINNIQSAEIHESTPVNNSKVPIMRTPHLRGNLQEQQQHLCMIYILLAVLTLLEQQILNSFKLKTC